MAGGAALTCFIPSQKPNAPEVGRGAGLSPSRPQDGFVSRKGAFASVQDSAI
jgi:hypothetical protein